MSASRYACSSHLARGSSRVSVRDCGGSCLVSIAMRLKSPARAMASRSAL